MSVPYLIFLFTYSSLARFNQEGDERMQRQGVRRSRRATLVKKLPIRTLHRVSSYLLEIFKIKYRNHIPTDSNELVIEGACCCYESYTTICFFLFRPNIDKIDTRSLFAFVLRLKGRIWISF